MQDDDKQQSYERLDETNPERNHRSFFDWLRGREETDEEKLRKKLDEELKEAARKRATDFEEERRVEEEREVSETKKLKKRWRAKLVEKSKKLLDKTTERDDESTSGYEIAKLMVAERIVKLDEMLHDDTLDLRRSEVKALKINIDFMGLLSEKLDRPELAVPEEVGQLYQTIAASVEETTGETLPETTPEEPEAPPVSKEDAAYTAFAGSIVQAIRRVMQTQLATPATTEVGTVNETPAPTSVIRPKSTRPASATEQLLTIVQRTALSGEIIRKELSKTEQARKLADVVERAAIFNRSIPSETPQPPKQTDAQPQKTSQETKQGFDLAPNQKIKYLSESELLRLAAMVEIGAGRLLSDVYKRGEIDREGLVKVLESYNKQQDYRSELAHRRDTWRRQQQQSPERLAEPAVSLLPQDTKSVKQSVARSKSLGQRILLVAPSKSAPNTSTLRLRQKAAQFKSPRFVRDTAGRLKRSGQVAILFASVLLGILLIVAVLELKIP